ncbi:MAG: DUF397 domain-containing protein [Patescibacteria group bacterium]
MARNKRFKVSDADFARSTYTDSQKYTWCVEVARKKRGVAVRDSRNRTGGTLFFTNNEWQAFVNGVKNGEFDPVGPVAKRLR